MAFDLFKLEKLKIAAFTDIKRSEKVQSTTLKASEMEVMYNPSTLTSSYTSSFRAPRGTGAAAPLKSPWLKSHGKRLSITLVFDGTNVSSYGYELLFGNVRSVADWIKGFLELCYDIQGKTHEPTYLRLTWGSGVLGPDGFECRLASANISYSAFDRDGSPLHASVAAEFVEALDPEKEYNRLQLSSPDLSHQRVVRAGDTLPQLCREIYGTPDHYLRVAEVNQLDDFRRLQPGTKLIFPPYDRRGRA